MLSPPPSATGEAQQSSTLQPELTHFVVVMVSPEPPLPTHTATPVPVAAVSGNESQAAVDQGGDTTASGNQETPQNSQSYLVFGALLAVLSAGLIGVWVVQRKSNEAEGLR
jgi:hypothetical protein